MTEAKRRLKNFNFEKDGAHVALVSKDQGGPANGYTTLITKATEGIPTAFIEKADKVQVTLTITEFLRKFFGMYYEDAEILARILGYDTEMSEEESPTDYEEFIQSKVDSVKIMKNLFRAEDISKALSEVTEEQFEQLLNDQKMIEKFMSSEGVTDGGVSKQNVENTKEDVTEMSDKPEMIAKSEMELAVAKAVKEALETKDAELQKALDAVKSYKEKEEEQIAKARKESLKDAVKDEAKAEDLFKSLSAVSEEDFNTVVETLKGLTKASDEGDLFVEKGVDTESEQKTSVDVTSEILKKQYAKD